MPLPASPGHAFKPAALILGAVVFAAAAARAPDRFDGWTLHYETTIATTGGSEKPSSGSLGSGRIRFAGTHGRVDELQGLAMMLTGPDGFIVMDLASGVTSIVNPTAKSYSVLDPAAIGGMMGAIENAGANIKIENAKVDVTDFGDGGAIAGHVTRHVRVARSWTTRISMLGMSHSTADSTIDEYWVATDLGSDLSLDRYQRALIQQWSSTGQTSKAAADLAEAMFAKMPKGFPMRQKTIQHLGEGAAASTITTTNEITAISKGDIDPSIFDIPSSYEKTEFLAPKPDTSGTAGAPRG